jgi:signal transduction histidine kinase
VLQEFLTSNRAVLIDRCRAMVASRSEPKAADPEFTHGIPIFLDQLITTLTEEQTSRLLRNHLRSNDSAAGCPSEVDKTATLHGRDLFQQGFTLAQVVRDYGDVCQAVTNLALETDVAITVDEFRTFNRCLDNAIAGAVTEYARYTALSSDNAVQALNSRLAPFAHELRNYLHSAILAVSAIKTGNVGISGATGAVLDRSLLGMDNLIDRALTEVRVTAGMPPRLERVLLAKFLAEVETSASLDALARGSRFTVTPVDHRLAVYVDPEMLAAAVSNLLQNAFKFTKPQSDVRLHTHVTGDRILIDVEDHCGGLPTGAMANLFSTFVQSGEDRTGLGLGLDICRRSVESNGGVLTVRDVPGSGCIFTIDLPQHTQS